MGKLKTDWKALGIKDKIAYTTAVFSFFFGWGLTIDENGVLSVS